MSITADFFRNRLDQMIDLRHPLAVLANRMPWQEIEASLAHHFARQVRAGKKIEDSDLFGATEVIAGAGVSKAGRPRKRIEQGQSIDSVMESLSMGLMKKMLNGPLREMNHANSAQRENARVAVQQFFLHD